MARPRVPLAERLWARVDRSAGQDGCWLWTGSTSSGYGQIGEGGVEGRHLVPHRVAYELLVGPIPDGMELDHLCRNRICCNPAHLESVTPRVNTLRNAGPTAVNASKTHCVNGHVLDEGNTYQRPTGGRACRTCKRRAA